MVALQTKVMISQPLIQNTLILRWPRVAIFVDIIKFVTMFIKAIFKSKKKMEIMYQNAICICIS